MDLSAQQQKMWKNYGWHYDEKKSIVTLYVTTQNKYTWEKLV